MRRELLMCVAGLGLAAASMGAHASQEAMIAGAMHVEGLPLAAVPKAASTQTIASRAVVSPSQTVFGGFQLAQQATVFILVRANSLGTLGVTSNFLDLPRIRLYDAAGRDLGFDTQGQPGGYKCLAAVAAHAPVVSYYQNVRQQPVHPSDFCFSAIFPAGAYTFSATPSIRGVTVPNTYEASSRTTGEILFEVTLGP